MKKFSLGSAIVLKIDGIQTSQVKYPTVGQLLEIENKKMLYSDGRYIEYVASPLKTKSVRFAIDVIEMLSHFSVLIPDLHTKLSVNSYLDLDPITAKELVKVYTEQFEPWYNNFLKVMYDIVDEDQQDDANAEQGDKEGTEE